MVTDRPNSGVCTSFVAFVSDYFFPDRPPTPGTPLGPPTDTLAPRRAMEESIPLSPLITVLSLSCHLLYKFYEIRTQAHVRPLEEGVGPAITGER